MFAASCCTENKMSDRIPSTSDGGKVCNGETSTRLDLYGVSKSSRNSRRYGSTGTISTAVYTTSSSSSSSQDDDSPSQQSNANKQYHTLSLDLTSIDNSDSSEDSVLLPGGHHSRDSSSYSDISDNGAGGYYDRFARHARQRSGGYACHFIENSVFTVNNLKVAFSFVLWFVSYMIMGVFGGSVAYLHFERKDSSVPDPLPDFGYDVIPVSNTD